MNKDPKELRFLYADDLLHNQKFKSITVEIERVYPKGQFKRAADGKPIDKVSIAMVGKTKVLVLAKTNVEIIQNITGHRDAEKWVGSKIKLGARIVSAFGDKCLALRVLPVEGTRLRRGLASRLGVEAIWVAGIGPTEKKAEKR